MNVKSCIQTIDSLRKLALNTHGVIDVVDDRNCQQIVDFLKKQEPLQPWYSCEKGLTCRNCDEPIEKYDAYCRTCGQAVKWE